MAIALLCSRLLCGFFHRYTEHAEMYIPKPGGGGGGLTASGGPRSDSQRGAKP